MLKLLGHQKQTFILLIPKGERRGCFSNPTTSLSSTTTPFSDTQKQLCSDLDPFEIVCSDDFFPATFQWHFKERARWVSDTDTKYLQTIWFLLLALFLKLSYMNPAKYCRNGFSGLTSDTSQSVTFWQTFNTSIYIEPINIAHHIDDKTNDVVKQGIKLFCEYSGWCFEQSVKTKSGQGQKKCQVWQRFKATPTKNPLTPKYEDVGGFKAPNTHLSTF